MPSINGYTTLAALKDLLYIESTDTKDDGMINDLITQVSRYIDDRTGRTFYPRVETHLLDIPEGRELPLDDDLLAVSTLLNGDAVAILAAEYILLPNNYYPKYAIALKQASSTYWETDADGNSEQVISVTGFWGFRQQYSQRGWATGSLLNEAPLDAVSLSFTVDAGTLFSPGQVIKIESELMNVSVVATNELTVVSRGDNGSTAATHAHDTPVYIWHPEPDIELACRMIVKNLYHNRFGQNTTATATITAAGVVLAPEDVPASAEAILKRYARLC